MVGVKRKNTPLKINGWNMSSWRFGSDHFPFFSWVMVVGSSRSSSGVKCLKTPPSIALFWSAQYLLRRELPFGCEGKIQPKADKTSTKWSYMIHTCIYTYICVFKKKIYIYICINMYLELVQQRYTQSKKKDYKGNSLFLQPRHKLFPLE